MPSRVMLGIGLSLASAVALLGWLWLDARENAQEAAQEARQLESNLRAVLDAERRSRELLDASQAILDQWQVERAEITAELTATRQTLTDIRAAARKEISDASLACAVRPVPASVDRLLRHQRDD
ncbi:hypothetical protein [uncultured Halomonas sp.]|uniref:hypothetical protein n=1 Tax=uncultured Halomonas sp. TaxID=173971 RepID=UPI00263598BF|nr:hypothetical protein [uncultured Halomonas sp.]